MVDDVYSLPDDAVLESQAVDIRAVYIERTVNSPRNGNMVDHVVAPFGNSQRIFFCFAIFSHSNTQVADDVISRIAIKGDTVAVNGNPASRGGLAGNVDVPFNDNPACNIDDTPDVENDDAARRTHGIPK